MDKDYLQNIAGSLHIDEGLGDRILARGSSGLQRFSAMSGGDIDDLNYKKVQTIFNIFVKKLITTLKDFAEGDHSVANRLQQMRPPLSATQRDITEKMRDLYSSLVPTEFQQHQLGHSVLNPKNRSSITEMLKEGIFSREMSLNKALQSNDPTKILTAYLSEIKKAYDNFLRDAQKVTGTPTDYIKRVVGNLDKKWAPILGKVESVINSPNTPVVAGAGQQSTPPETVSADPNTATDVPPSSPEPVDVTKPTDDKTPEPNSVEEDFVSIATNVIDVIINAVEGDSERSAPYFKPVANGGTGYEDLPADWDAPSVTKEASEPKPDTDKLPVKDAPPGEKTEFLYNFHSLYRKQRHFAIEVPSSNNNTYTNRKTKQLNKIDVIWSNNSHENNIYVKHTPVEVAKGDYEVDTMNAAKLNPTGKSGDVLILKFYDDQVNPRDAQSKNFSIQLLLDQANKTATQILKKVSRTNPKLLLDLNHRTDKLRRALYATVSRKRMEFKPKKSVALQLKDGEVFFKGKPVSQAEIKQKLFSSSIIEAKNWLEALDDVDYFSEHPEMLASRNKADAILQLVGQDVLHSDAIDSVMNSSSKVGSIENVPVSTLVTLAKQYYLAKKAQDDLSGGPTPVTITPAPSTVTTSTPAKTKIIPTAAPTAAPTVQSPSSVPVTNNPVPVSVKPIEPPKPVTPSIEISDTGAITGKDPKSGEIKTWKPGHALPDAIRAQIKSDPKLMAKLEDIIAKRKAAKAAKTKPPVKTTEGLINPFDPNNFL